MIDYPKICAFCEIAGCLSFTEAASRLYTTQSSLSKSIASLEKTLKCQLFVRSNRHVTLTPAGEYLYNYFKKMLHDTEIAAARAQEINAGKRGHIEIGIYGLHGIEKRITDKLLCFCQDNPLYSFGFIPMTVTDTRELIIAKEVDAVITREQDVRLITECEYLIMDSCELVCIARCDHPLFDEIESPTLDAIKDYKFTTITPSFSPHTYNLIIETCQANGFSPNVNPSDSSYYGTMMNVATTDYIGFMEESDCHNKEVFRRIPIRNAPMINTVIAWNRTNISQNLKKLIDYLDDNELKKRTL